MTTQTLPRSDAAPRSPGFDRALAMRLAADEHARCADVLARLRPEHWSIPTVNTGWEVRDTAALTPAELVQRWRETAPTAVRGRRRMPTFVLRRTMPESQLVGGRLERWTLGDVVDEWAARHAAPYALHLTGPAGGAWGTGRERITLDALDFCRIVSGRGEATGLLATAVPF